MDFSPDYSMLATCSNLGSVKVWDTSDWKLLIEFRDKQVMDRTLICISVLNSFGFTKEPNIEEFYVLCWSDDSKHIIAAGT